MKLTVLLLATALATLPLLGQEPAPSRAKKEPAVTAVERPGQAAPAGSNGARPDAGEDMLRIPSPARNASAPAADSPEAVTVNLWKLVQSGGWAMVPLGVLSVLTGMLVFAYTFTLRRGAVATSNFMNTADVLLKKRDYLGLLAISSRHSEAVARVVQRTLDFATKNPNASFDTVRDIAETEGSAQAASLQHRTTYLADIGMLSPMIGLLGTVVGIIHSFGVLAAGGVSQSRDVLLAEGVSEALVATASGLILGIIAMGFYALFRNKVQTLISDLEIASAHLMGLIALNYQKKRENSRVSLDEEF